MSTDTNRLARAREFLEQRFRMQEPYPTQIAQIMQDYAEREVKAAVEWTPINSAEDLPKEDGWYLITEKLYEGGPINPVIEKVQRQDGRYFYEGDRGLETDSPLEFIA